jgi:exopolysaccharide production protein ExoQ
MASRIALPPDLQAAIIYSHTEMNAQTSAVMAKSRGYQHVWLSGALAWIVAVFAILVQQHDLTDPLLLDPNALAVHMDRFVGPVPNNMDSGYYGRFALASLVSIVIASSLVYRDIVKLLARNVPIIAYIGFVVMSAAWSIHPDITLRRALGCILTILVAAYLVVRFDEKDRMKLFSLVFVIPAIVSLFAIAGGGEAAGGTIISADGSMIYQKNILGKIMSVAIFVELYLLALGNWRPIWRFGLLSIYLTLLIISQSVTSWLCAMMFLGGTAIYIIGKRNKLAGMIAVVTLAWLLILLQLGLWYNADLLLAIFGKNSTLTGRTDIWLATLDLIQQKPLLGWGYMATWVPTDPQTLAIWAEFRWIIGSAHNAYLDVALQLGVVGLGLLLTIIAVAWYRAQACCKRGILTPGWFSLVFIAGALLHGASETGLGQNQSIIWLLLNVFSFSCGLKLASLGSRGQYRDRLRPEFAAGACNRKPAGRSATAKPIISTEYSGQISGAQLHG